MRKSVTTKEIFDKIGYVLDCIVLTLLLVIAFGVLVKSMQMDLPRLQYHIALVLGFLSFFVLFLIPRVRANTRWMMKFNHEFTHLVFALLFFRKIYRFKVDSKDSHVSYSGGWFGYLPITVSPYCVPLLTLALLPWRYTTGSAIFLLGIDFIIGLSYAFHVCCWISQIRLYQTDITGPGVTKSLLTIASFLILNACLVLLTPSSGVELAISRVFWIFPREFFSQMIALIP